jgi:hypothetical protein
MQSVVRVVSRWKSVDIIVRTVSLRSRVLVFEEKRTGGQRPLRFTHSSNGLMPNRCARNCFQCPHCHNTLSVVPSDPPERDPGSRLPIIINPVGEPPFILYCSFCRWDSEEVGISFEKPTGLACKHHLNIVTTCHVLMHRFAQSATSALRGLSTRNVRV